MTTDTTWKQAETRLFDSFSCAPVTIELKPFQKQAEELDPGADTQMQSNEIAHMAM